MFVSHPSVPLARCSRTGAESPVRGASRARYTPARVRVASLRLYRIRDPSEEVFSRRQRNSRVYLLPELPKRADAEPQVAQHVSKGACSLQMDGQWRDGTTENEDEM